MQGNSGSILVLCHQCQNYYLVWLREFHGQQCQMQQIDQVLLGQLHLFLSMAYSKSLASLGDTVSQLQFSL